MFNILSKNSKKTDKRGQSTIEYILLVTAVLAFLISFLQTGGIFQREVNATYTAGLNTMSLASDRLFDGIRAQLGNVTP